MARVLAFVIAAAIVFVFAVAALLSQETINSGDRFPWSMSLKQQMPTVSSGDRFMVRSMPMKQQMLRNFNSGDVLRNLKKGDAHNGLRNLKRFLTYGYLQRLGQPHTPPTTLLDDNQCNSSLSVTGILDRAPLDTLRIQPRKLMGRKRMWHTTRNKKEINRVKPISCGVSMNQKKADQLLSTMPSQFDALRNFKNGDTPKEINRVKPVSCGVSMNQKKADQLLNTMPSQFDALRSFKNGDTPKEINRVKPISCGVSMNQKKVFQLPSQFDALRSFKNGDTPNRLEDLKRYLPRLSEHYTPPATLFNNPLVAALRRYQSNYNLSVTGVLDRATLDTMRIQQRKLMDTVQHSSHGGKDYSPKKVMIPSMNEQAYHQKSYDPVQRSFSSGGFMVNHQNSSF